jgi:hypothetical protein
LEHPAQNLVPSVADEKKEGNDPQEPTPTDNLEGGQAEDNISQYEGGDSDEDNNG